MPRKHSRQTSDLLRALAAHPKRWRYGYDLGREVGLHAGTLYPILMRLTDRGLLEGTWESEPPAGRPARHLYRLTAAGRQAGRALPELSAENSAVAAKSRPQPRSAW